MCAWLTLPGINNVSTVPASAKGAVIKKIAATHKTVVLRAPCVRMVSNQYTLIATTCTIPAINNMKNSGTCSTCQNENKRAYI